jgi:hypothetical protein
VATLRHDSKRSRAEKKAADEIKLRLQKEGEIEELATDLSGLKVERVDTSQIVEKVGVTLFTTTPLGCNSSAYHPLHIHTSLHCTHVMTAGMVHLVTNLTPPGSECNPTRRI